MLSPYRVLDFSDERGHLCGYMLAALGADVIAIEPPGGSRSRRLRPFVGDIPDPDRSLTHFAYNRGKRSVVLDLDDELDRQRLEQLLAASDVVIESEKPGRMDELGLGAVDLAVDHPHLVVASISAFGQRGPKARWAATDLTVMASACTLSVTGDDDRAPVRVSVPQGFHFGAASAVSGVIASLIERDHSGLGQHVDAAAQWTATLGTQAGVLATGVGNVDVARTAGGAVMGGIRLRLVYPAADGYVSITHVFGMPIGQNTGYLMDWVHEEGFCDEATRAKDWVNYAQLLDDGSEPVAEWERAKEAVAAFTASKTKDELLAGAMERRLLMAPISTPADVLASAQAAEREFFEKVEHPVTGQTLRVPGAFAKCSATPLKPLGPAPTVGQHNDEILGKGGLWNRLELLPQPGPLRADLDPSGELPLSNLKILDFTWSIAGPHAVRVLSDLGAQIIKVESANKQDGARGFSPCHNNEAGIENSALFDNMAAGKRSLALDMSKPEALDVVHDLVGWCDVVIDSFSPKAMPQWGLEYENLRKLNPEVIMVSTCLSGQTGPLANFAGYGNLGAAFAGFYGLAGWPDRPPAGPFGAYTDYTSTHFLAATVLAAVDHRRRTGEGQYIDMSQSEAAQHFLTPAFLELDANGRLMERAGNRDPDMSPHGVYPTDGDDQWIAIACEDNQQWEALADLMGRADLLDRTDLADSAQRVARADEVDDIVSAWTAGLDAHQLTEQLQNAGIAAHHVANGRDCLADPQLEASGHFIRPSHPSRDCLIENTRFRLSRTPTNVAVGPPLLGEHTYEILTDVLGYDADRIAELAAAELLE